jgi:LacI family transcriptional regulator
MGTSAGAAMSKSTIVAIAEQAGVSTATVSRALNNMPGVGEETRRRILALAAELNYYPNVIARSLQGKRTNTVAYVADVSNRPAADLLFKDFITILADRCARYGMDLLIHPATTIDADHLAVARILRSGRADGIILADTRQHDPRLIYLIEQRLPFIAFGRSEIASDYAYVDIDGEWGIFTATSHLVARGHRRVAYLSLPFDYSYAIHRHAGYLRALQESGLVYDPALLTVVSNETETREAMTYLLDLPSPPTALVAASDLLAIYAMSVAAQRGLHAGRDYAITGFDDLPLAAHTSTPLTTMRQPFDLVCDELIALLYRVMHNEPGPHQILLRPELIVRGSS